MSDITDPMERILADALTMAGVSFEHEGSNTRALDFWLIQPNVFVEVKRLHSPRIAAQMARADDVVAVQGKGAVEWLAGLLTDRAHLARELRETTAALLEARAALTEGGSA